MQEAQDSLCSPRQLRFLFIVLITEGAPARHLFDTYRNFMFQDFKLQKVIPDDEAANCLLNDLALRLESYSRTLQDYNLPLGMAIIQLNSIQFFSIQRFLHVELVILTWLPN